MADQTQPRLFPAPLSPSIGPTLDRAAIIAEVQSGLRNERGRLTDALENANFLDLQGGFYTPRREAETEFDYAGRIKRVTGLTHQAINRLCEHTYNPGPLRTAAKAPAAARVLEQVYETTHIDAVMHEAERLSTLNDVCCIQVTVPIDPEKRRLKPIDLQIWGSEEFAVFLDPNDQRQPVAVVVLDKYDEHTRYRLWFADVVHTYTTRKLDRDDTRSGVIAVEMDGSPEPNPYGCLPFAFLHYQAPVRQFWTNAVGSFVREAEKSLNAEASELAEAIQKFGKPIGWFKNVGPEFNPEVGPGRFLRLIRGGAGYGGDGFESQGEPDAGYLQAQLAIAEIWEDIRGTMRQVAEAIDLPPSALQLDYSDAPSGLSIMIRTAPLLTRARQRRPIYQMAECQLARVILCVYGSFYGRADLVAASKTLVLTLAWPEPRIPIPGEERDNADAWELQLGIKSRLRVIQERYGLNPEQALEHLKRVAEEERQATAILPRPEPVPPPEEDQDDDQVDDEQADERDDDQGEDEGN